MNDKTRKDLLRIRIAVKIFIATNKKTKSNILFNKKCLQSLEDITDLLTNLYNGV